ncbi:MAG: Fe-S protein assembly co-chaperone HscB [Buchnera aphidicola (Floraphis choui)]
MNYFQLFNLPQKFEINIEKLKLQFYKLQKQYHPDISDNIFENKNNKYLDKSISINKGYQTLKDPLKRAEHLLLLNSYDFKKKQKELSENIFLYKQLELYEKLDKLKKNIKKKLELHNFYNNIKNKKKCYLLELELMLDKKNWKLAATILYKLFFYKKLEEKLENVENI